LLAKKLVTRKEHPSDTRAKILGLTESGITLHEQATRIVETADRELYHGKNVDRDMLNTILSQLL